MKSNKLTFAITSILISFLFLGLSASDKIGKYKYDDFQTPEYCGASCHNDFYGQWKNAMMSQAYTHE